MSLTSNREELLASYERACLFGMEYADYDGLIYKVDDNDLIIAYDFNVELDKDEVLNIPLGVDVLSNNRIFHSISKQVRHIDLGTVKSLPTSMFRGFTSLKTVTGKYLESINSYCFYGLTLDEINFPNLKTVLYLGFNNCKVQKAVLGKYVVNSTEEFVSLMQDTKFREEYGLFGMVLV